MNVFASIEALDDDVDVSADDVVMEEVMFEVWESDQEIEEVTAELDEMERAYEAATNSMKELEVLAGSIEEFGISSVVMKTMDPSAVLVQRGMVVDYDELDITPVKDANAVAAVEGIKESLKKMMEKLQAFFRKVGKMIVEVWRKLFRAFKSYDKAIAVLIKKLETAAVDPAKLGEIKMKGYNAKDLQMIKAMVNHILKFSLDNQFKPIVDEGHVMVSDPSKATDDNIKSLRKKLADVVNGLDNSDLKDAGVEVKVENDQVRYIKSIKPKYSTSKDTVKALGYDQNNIIKLLKDCQVTLKDTDKLSKLLPITEKQYKNSADTIQKTSKILDDDPTTVRNVQAAVGIVRDALAYQKLINSFVLNKTRDIATKAMAAAKSVLKAAK